jgi:rare lipoprotein A (peptidoglycan hydrolase)
MHPRNKRLIDLSQAAAAKLGLLHQGLGEVQIRVMTDEKGTIAFH